MMYAIRQVFPVFEHYPDLVYLDNAATTQKPREVIEAERVFYERYNANVHRGIYPLAAAATEAYERTREKVRTFLNAAQSREIIFTSGTTDSINLVAQSFALDRLDEGDAIAISALEHHSNLIPWQQVCLQKKARLLVIPVSRAGALELDAIPPLLRGNRVKLLALAHVSNSLGTVNPIQTLIAMAHSFGVPVLVDAAQSAATLPLDVQALDVDFLTFSAHKMFGPTGVGVLYGKTEWLEQMAPYRFGGEMIRDVTFERTLFAALPQKFEAGTPNIAGVAAFSAALDFISAIGREKMAAHSRALLDYATAEVRRIPGLDIIGTAPEKSGILSFLLGQVHPHDIATILGEQQICIRAGHHCTQPLMDFLDLPGTARASFSVYNTAEDVARLVAGLRQVEKMMRPAIS